MDEHQELLAKVLNQVRGCWRFRWAALGVAWAVCLLGWAYVLSLPNIYQSSARVYLDSQSVLRPLLQGLAVNPDIESDLSLVKQALLSKPQLEKVAHQSGLDLAAKTDQDRDALIASLQKNIEIQKDVRVSNSSTDGVYLLSFKYQNRDKALAVVQRLLDSFVENTLGSKRNDQVDAQQFLQDQLTEYEKRLTDSENKLSEFKKQNVGRMPTDRGDYFQRLQTEQASLDSARGALALAEARRDETNSQLAGEEPMIFGITDGGATAAAGSKSGDIAARIRDLEGRLEELLLKYTEKHPEVISVRGTLDALRIQQSQELARIKKGQPSNGSLSSSLKLNPVYQSLQIDKNKAEVQVAELQSDVAVRSARVAELRRMINVVPDVEAELGRLNRDYEVTRTQYQQLLQRLETSRLSEEADKTGTVNFKIIDPPSALLVPVAPKRSPMLIGVLVLGLGAGAAVAFGLNLFRPVFHNARILEAMLEVPVLGCIGFTASTEQESASRRRLFLFGAVSCLLFATYFGVAILSASDGGRLLERIFS